MNLIFQTRLGAQIRIEVPLRRNRATVLFAGAGQVQNPLEQAEGVVGPRLEWRE